MIVRIRQEPFRHPLQRALRLQGIGLLALGIGVLAVWNPLTQPGPKMCLLRHTVGLPCPLCGMTRGVALCLRGHPIEASLFNPLAGLVLLVALVLAVKWAIEFARRRSFDVMVSPRFGRGLVVAAYVVLLVNWAYLLIYRREDLFATSWLGQMVRWLGG